MSGPNTSYDPVQVTPLNAESVEAMVADASAAFAAATTVAELKQARLSHVGDRSPIALANGRSARCRLTRARRLAVGSAKRGTGSMKR